jgi:NAD(P)-dependent dehydrogenase (short-subunit alcohol dehydrogenase family)
MAARPRAVILGAYGDIGGACARLLAAEGWNLVLVGRDARKLLAITHDIRGGECDVVTHCADMESSEDTRRAVDSIHKSYGEIRGLVNAVGVRGTRWEESTAEAWHRTLQVNVVSFVEWVRGLQDLLAASGRGAVVSVSSLAAREGYYKPDYSASKAALEAATRSVAVLLARSGVRANCVAPGPVVGRMTASWDACRRDAAIRRIPLGRLASPDDVAAGVAFLLSSRAEGITGAVLEINGGVGCCFL